MADLHIPARSGVGDQILESVTNAGGNEEQVIRLGGGFGPADVSLAITSAATTVGGSTDYSSVGNITVTFRGTHAGVALVFEASDDGGSNWYTIAGAREDSGISQTSTGVLASNTSYSWAFSMLGFDRFRVKSTAWTSGVANLVTISAGTLPFQPKVSSVQANPPNATTVSAYTAVAGVTSVTTEALLTMIIQRDLTPAATATTFTVPVGKTFRVLSVTGWVRNGAATAVGQAINLRAIKTGTIAATTGGIVVPLWCPVPATAGTTSRDTFTPSSSFLELQSGWSWGISQILSATSAGTVCGATITGIEF